MTTAARIDAGRKELLEAFLEQMNGARIPYCLLNGFQGYPEVITSDVDFMIHPSDAERIPALLLAAAKQCGALLVQAIRHETGAWYFVLAKQVGSGVAYLHPDCTTDYRRDGRLWLVAEQVLRKRRPYKTFFVPAIADEFLYYLTKKVLKQHINSAQWQRMEALYLSCPEECSERLRRFWSATTADALLRMLARQEIGWMQFYLPALLSELRGSVPVESWWKRANQRLREWRRCMERALRPTGLGVAVCGGTEQCRSNFAIALQENLRPAFRRTVMCAEETTGDSLWGAAAFWLAKVRSTLVIRRKELPERGRLERDEIGFVLDDPELSEGAGEQCGGVDSRHGCAVLDGSQSLEHNLERATRLTLEYLAARLRERMNLKDPSLMKGEMLFDAKRRSASPAQRVE